MPDSETESKHFFGFLGLFPKKFSGFNFSFQS